MRILGLLASLLVGIAALPLDGSGAQAAGRHRMSFTPGDRSRFEARGRSVRHGGRHVSQHRSRPARRLGRSPTAEPEGGETAVPGAGFKLQDGVLTYPAPARFQPRNLKRR